MRVGLLPASWYQEEPTSELVEACKILGDGAWREAAIAFYAKRAARLRRGRSAPKGMQSELNNVIDSRFYDAGWIGSDGRFVKGSTWVRVTFRHQMSLGSDFIDAAKVCAKEGCTQAAILAGESDWLRLVSPNDWRALVSFEKVRIAAAELQGGARIASISRSAAGRIAPAGGHSGRVAQDRPRDTTVPQ